VVLLLVVCVFTVCCVCFEIKVGVGDILRAVEVNLWFLFKLYRGDWGWNLVLVGLFCFFCLVWFCVLFFCGFTKVFVVRTVSGLLVFVLVSWIKPVVDFCLL